MFEGEFDSKIAVILVPVMWLAETVPFVLEGMTLTLHALHWVTVQVETAPLVLEGMTLTLHAADWLFVQVKTAPLVLDGMTLTLHMLHWVNVLSRIQVVHAIVLAGKRVTVVRAAAVSVVIAEATKGFTASVAEGLPEAVPEVPTLTTALVNQWIDQFGLN